MDKTGKNIIIIMIIAVVVVIFTSAAVYNVVYKTNSPKEEINTQPTTQLTITHDTKDGLFDFQTLIIIDEKTGVNYIVMTDRNSSGGISITPRLNADGTLYISK